MNKVIYLPSQKTTAVRPWMNARRTRHSLGKGGLCASADSAEEIKDTTGVNPWRFHEEGKFIRIEFYESAKNGKYN